jgi:hypothetical protein
MGKSLMRIEYNDFAKKIGIAAYADTIVFDESNGKKILCAVRFGGYPEQVGALSNAIMGGGTAEVVIGDKTARFATIAKAYRRKTEHGGIYAETTLVAESDARKEENPKREETKENEPKDKAQETPESGNPLAVRAAFDLPARNAYIYVPPGDRAALFDSVDRETSVPMIPEFADWLLSELERRKELSPLKIVSSAPAKFEAWKLKCERGDANVIEVVERGLKNGDIAIPGTQGRGKALALDSLNDMTDYLTKHGKDVAERIKAMFVPLFDPNEDELSPEVKEINGTITEKAGYSLCDAQLAVAEAVKRQLERHKTCVVVAECGTGKTKIGLTALSALLALPKAKKRSKEKKAFCIVLCPAHVARKWIRETEESLAGASARVVSSVSQFDSLYESYEKGGRSCLAIIPKEAARDGYMRAPAVPWSRRGKAFACPDCGEAVKMSPSGDDCAYEVNADQFFFKAETRHNHKCAHCGSPLWTALNPLAADRLWVKIGGYGFVFRPDVLAHLAKTKNPALIEKILAVAKGSGGAPGACRKYPLSAHVKRKYKGRIDGLIVDELHQYNNDSGQGDAMCELKGASKNTVGLTATLINGYSSGIFHLLYRLVPGLMQSDGQSHGLPSAFGAEYGVVENVYEISEGAYNANRRSVKRKKRSRQLPGVSPLVYSRFLLEHAVFLSLSDMGKELPEYEEIPVALRMPKEVATAYFSVRETLVKFMKSDRKAARKIMSAYLNLLMCYPDQPYGLPPVLHPTDGFPIVIPPDAAVPGTVLPKDETVMKIASEKLDRGERVLVYTNRTGIGTQEKLLKLFSEAGYEARILSASVKPSVREEWIEKRLGEGMRVLIANPTIVETGLDLNAFTALIFYDTGTKLFTMRQASRRSWRINQTAPRVEVYMLYYADTMQHKLLKLMGTKLAVAAIIEGGFSEEGLAAMSQCEDLTTLMAKELMLGIKDSVEDVSASFRRMSSAGRFRAPVIFTDVPVKISANAASDAEIEFTFSATDGERKPAGSARLPITRESGKKAFSENEGQIDFFKDIA